MMQIVNFFIPTKSFYFRKENTEQERCDAGRWLIVQIRSKTEPENRLWKLSMGADSRKGRRLELIAFLFFGVLVSAAAVYCCTELLHVINSGALEQTVQALLTR
jgi:hypothetical protein